VFRLFIAILISTTINACSRPLTNGERAFSADVIGDSLDADKIRVAVGFGLNPPPPTPNAPIKGKRATIPGICKRVPHGPRTEPPPAFALYNTVHLRSDLYRAETAPGWPDHVLLPQSLIMAHELVHVWQWQNRARTGYRPARAALESLINIDPYYYHPDDGDGFLSFGYEQQAALVEDYFCYALLDPANPRRNDLRSILEPHFPVARIDTVTRH